MDNLEFEIVSTSGIKYDIKEEIVDEKNDPQLNIAHSIKIIAVLQDKLKEHNKAAPSNKVTLKELKQVYMDAVQLFDKSITSNINTWSLSKVFLYLRMKRGERVESTYANIEVGDEIDISIELTPSEKDMELASACVKEKELDYEFKNADDLYLEEYKPISFVWE